MYDTGLFDAGVWSWWGVWKVYTIDFRELDSYIEDLSVHFRLAYTVIGI